MATGSYYPKTLKVPCPTHGPRRFKMDLLRDAYICPDREKWDAPTRVDSADPPEMREMVIRPEGPNHLHLRLEDGRLMGGCLWVVTLELLFHNPDGADPIRMAKPLEFKL